MNMMPLCFVTMVRGDHIMLTKWISHHERLVESRSALHIFLHGEDRELRELASGCSVVVLPFDPTGEGFEESRRKLFFGLAGALRGYYRHVVALDCDEFIVLDPDHHKTLAEYLCDHPYEGAALSPVGFDVVQRLSEEQDPVDFSFPILEQRKYGFLDGVYSKPCIFRRQPTGGTQHSLARERWEIDPAIFLFHFRFFDVEYSKKINSDRMALVARFEESGANHLIGTWKDRDERFSRVLKLVNEAECPLMTDHLVEDFMNSQLENYKARGGRFMWRDSRRGPYKIPSRFANML